MHHGHTDLFYVLEGELTLRLGIDDDAVSLPAGTLARVPPNVVHGFRNGSDSEVRYLNFHAPARRSRATFVRSATTPSSGTSTSRRPTADARWQRR